MGPDLTIVLLGNTGVGKSASGNTILRRQVFESKPSLQPVTREISEATGHVLGRQISVVDTPGILGSEQLIETCCQDLLRSSRPCLFLVVVKTGWFSNQDQEAVEAAIRVLGDEGLRNSFLLFTGADALKHRLLDDFISEDGGGSLQAVVNRFGGRRHLFNNQYGGQEQVEELLRKSDLLSLLPSASAAVLADPVGLEDRRIVLLGRPGGGRSSSGNTILGSERFRSGCDFNSVSTETVSESVRMEGRQVTVVDTPGFTDEVLTHEHLYLEIMKTLVKASPGPHAFVIVVRLGSVSEGDKNMYKMLQRLFGADASKFTMVLFTHGDEVRGRSIDQMIRFDRHVSELVSMCGGRFCVFDNRETGNREQVRKLLNMVDQMVTDNRGEHCSSELFTREQRNRSRVKWIKKVWERLKPFVVSVVTGGVIGVWIGLCIHGGLGGGIGGGIGGLAGAVICALRC